MNLSSWNISKITNLYSTFSGCSGLTNLDVSSWDILQITNLYSTFSGCRGLTNLNISNWDTQKVTDTTLTFSNCTNLINLDISHWNLGNVVVMNSMFSYCNNLGDESLDGIITALLTAINVSYKNLNINNVYSPFRKTNITNDRYQNRWTELDAAGWKY